MRTFIQLFILVILNFAILHSIKLWTINSEINCSIPCATLNLRLSLPDREFLITCTKTNSSQADSEECEDYTALAPSVVGSSSLCSNVLTGIFTDWNINYEIHHNPLTRSQYLEQRKLKNKISQFVRENDKVLFPILETPILKGNIEVEIFYDKYLIKNFSDDHKATQNGLKEIISDSGRLVKKLGFSLEIKNFTSLDYNFQNKANVESIENFYTNYLRTSGNYDLKIIFLHQDRRILKDSSAIYGSHQKRVCSPPNNFILIFYAGNATSAILTHKVGHALGLPHDQMNCHCGDAITNCIMHYKINKKTILEWSNCSIDFLNAAQSRRPFICLLNNPLTKTSLCGNGIVDPGETCDCVSELCHSCCSNCQLTVGSTCGSGSCCDFAKCKHGQCYSYKNQPTDKSLRFSALIKVNFSRKLFTSWRNQEPRAKNVQPITNPIVQLKNSHLNRLLVILNTSSYKISFLQRPNSYLVDGGDVHVTLNPANNPSIEVNLTTPRIIKTTKARTIVTTTENTITTTKRIVPTTENTITTTKRIVPTTENTITTTKRIVPTTENTITSTIFSNDTVDSTIDRLIRDYDIEYIVCGVAVILTVWFFLLFYATNSTLAAIKSVLSLLSKLLARCRRLL